MTHYIRTLTFGLSLAMTLVASSYAADASDSKTATQAAAQQGDPLVREAATRHTPPWTNDSANINNDRLNDRGSLQPAAPVDSSAFTVTQNMKDRFSDPKHIFGTTGAEIFENSCQACHMARGTGAEGAGHYPALANNPHLATPMYPMIIVLNGLHGMPPFRGKLDDAQIAAVVNYLMKDLNNSDLTITEKDVATARQPLDETSSY